MPSSEGAGEQSGWWARLQQAVGLLATMATLAVAAFTWVSVRQVANEQAITREGQITDRYNTAVTDLGNSSPDVRIGSIYALQRIMHDSPRDQPAISNVLSAYIRTHAPLPTKEAPGPPQPNADTSAALNVLGSRNAHNDGTAHVDLRNTDLGGADLHDLDFSGADMRGAYLFCAGLPCTNLTATNLRGANLAGADMHGADLEHANLTDADLTGTNLEHVDLTGTKLLGARLRRTRGLN